jgi:hypothetical protein
LEGYFSEVSRPEYYKGYVLQSTRYGYYVYPRWSETATLEGRGKWIGDIWEALDWVDERTEKDKEFFG